MSTVIGLIKNGKIWMGADSQATANDGHIRPIVCEKIFRNKKFVIGFAGGLRSGQILQPEYFNPPGRIQELPDSIRIHLQACGCLSTDDEYHTEQTITNYIVAYKNELYEILSDFQLNKVIEYTAIGSGSGYAYGSLYTTRKNKNIRNRIEYALMAAEIFDVSTGKPFTIIEC